MHFILELALSVSMAIGINPNPVQAVIGGSGTSTNKLRSLASLVERSARVIC
jgi:hypothetical protein